MLLGNYALTNKCPVRFLAGSASSTETGMRASFQRNGIERDRFYIDQRDTAIKTWSEPTASYPPYCYTIMPQRGSFMSSRRETWATFTATATGLRGMPGEGSATFAITTNAPAGELIVSGSGSASFSVTTNAPLLVASLNGYGSASFAIATGTPILGAIADLTASTSFAITTNAPIIYPLDDSSPLRTGSATFAFSGFLTRYAVGHMEGSALPYTELSPQTLASAVWDSVLVDYQQDGSAGKSLSTASSGGVDLNLMAQAVWEYVSRTLTEGASPSESDIVAALQATTIPVDVRKMNGSTLLGNGTESDKWRGSGV